MEIMVREDGFWKGKRILLTGETGFKGAWLSLWLHMLGANVLGFSKGPVTDPNLYNLLKLADKQKSVVADICNYRVLSKVVEDFCPQIVIHFAAQAIVRHSYFNPLDTFSSNVMGTVNLLEACRSSRCVRVVLNVTSDKCYKNKEWLWGYRENEELGGNDPYSCSKACAELINHSFTQSFFHENDYEEHGVAIATARAGNVIGGGDWSADRLIPDCVRAVVADEQITIRNPEAVRPWQYVLDPLNGYLLLIEKLFVEGPVFNGSWNFGPHDEDCRNVKEVVEMFLERIGGVTRLVLRPQNRSLSEANVLKLDCSKAKSLLGWKAVIPLEKSIEEIANWTKAFVEGKNMQKVSLEQIKAFCRYEGIR